MTSRDVTKNTTQLEIDNIKENKTKHVVVNFQRFGLLLFKTNNSVTIPTFTYHLKATLSICSVARSNMIDLDRFFFNLINLPVAFARLRKYHRANQPSNQYLN